MGQFPPPGVSLTFKQHIRVCEEETEKKEEGERVGGKEAKMRNGSDE